MSTTEPAFDWAQAASLLGENPNHVDGEMAGIVRELVDGVGVQFQELKSKDGETDRKTISSLAHGLRGCLLNFGFTEVGTILLDVEQGTFSSTEYQMRIDQAKTAFALSKSLLAARYPALGLS